MGNRNSGFSVKMVAAAVMAVVGLVLLIIGITGFFNTGKKKTADVRDSIVWVYSAISDSQGNSLAMSGTGWAVGTPGQGVQYFVTNGHVVQNVYEYTRTYADVHGEVRIYFSYADNDYVVPEVVYYSGPSEKDIAILRIATPTNKRSALVIRPSGNVEIGERAYSLGFPGDSQDRSAYNTFDKDDITITSGIISKRTGVLWASYETFQMDVMIASGSSGGPLVDKDGYAIGINVAAATDESGIDLNMYYAITTDELTRILNIQRISYAAKGYKNWMIFTFIPLGILILAAGAALLLILMNKQKQSKPIFREAASGYGNPRFAPGGEGRASGANYGMNVNVPLQRSQVSVPGKSFGVQSPAQMQSAPPEQAAQRSGAAYSSAAALNIGETRPLTENPVLNCTDGEFAGKTFEIKGDLVIGRNPAVCRVLFGDKTPGISGNHCKISYDILTGSFVLTDIGSSYGTFLEDGRRLTPNVPEKLYAGAIFYLADGKNRFKLEMES